MSHGTVADGVPKAGAALLVVLLPSLIAAAYVANGHALTILALVVCLVVMIPIVVRKQRLDLFSPWNYLFYFVLLNVLFRSILIDFEITGDRVDLNNIFYLDESPDFLIQSMGIVLLGFTFLTLGYMLPSNAHVKLNWRIFRSQSFDPARLKRLLAWMLLISFVSFAAFAYVTFEGFGEFAWRLLSSHRGLSEDLSEYRAHGYLRLLAGLSNIVLYLAYVRLRTDDRERGFYRFAFFAAISVSLAMAFYSQSRAALIFTFLNIVFIKYYLENQRLPWRTLAVSAPVVIALFIVTSSLRAGAGVDLTERVTPMTIVAPIILTNGGIDASKTGHIIDYIDDTQDYKLGQTLVQFVWAIVPREIWVQKPANLDTFIGEKIYGAETYGAAAVPPGFFAEMYMNFWYAGIVVGALVLGIVMKRINNLLIGNKSNVSFILCYVVLLQSFGMSMLGSGVSSTIIGVLTSGLPLFLALRFVTQSPIK